MAIQGLTGPCVEAFPTLLGKTSGSYRLRIEDVLAKSEPTAGSIYHGVGCKVISTLGAAGEGDVDGEGDGEVEALGPGPGC